MNFKKILILTLILSLFSTGFCKYAEASGSDVSPAETYGLICAAGLMEYEENFPMNSLVSKELFSGIFAAYFGESPEFDSDSITNSDAVFNLGKFCVTDSSLAVITQFKDFGFIKPEHREAYRKLCSSGYLNGFSEFLMPNKELTFTSYFTMLSGFKDFLTQRHEINSTVGQINDSTSKNNTIIITLSSGNKIHEFKFNRNDKFLVFKDSSTALYSYNLKKGDNVIFYTKDDKIIFASAGINKDIDPYTGFEFVRSTLYLYNPYDKVIIVKGDSKLPYRTFAINENTIIYQKNEKKQINDINTHLLDISCCVIVDKETNTAKYVNIIG